MDSLPSVIVDMIFRWKLEFDRLDAIERVHAFRRNYVCMKDVYSDIRSNTPVYLFNILTASRHHISLRLFLPYCDPQKVGPQLPLTESCIVSYTRCAIGCVRPR